MRLATLKDGSPDGRLVCVSPDGAHCAPAPVTTLQAALEGWSRWAPALAAVNAFPDALPSLTFVDMTHDPQHAAQLSLAHIDRCLA